MPTLVQQLAERKLSEYCRRKVSPDLADQLRLGSRSRGNAVTLFESRPLFADPAQWVDIPLAQFRHDPQASTWTLYCADQNSRWHLYVDANLAKKIDTLLQKVDDDPTGIFWG